MILLYIGEILTELKLGNGTSLLIFTNIVSSLPSSFGQTIEEAGKKGDSLTVLPVFFGAFMLSTIGRAVQVDPMKPMLKPPGTKHLKLKYGTPLPTFAFKFNLRRHTSASCTSRKRSARSR
jgi:hypothetical protein